MKKIFLNIIPALLLSLIFISCDEESHGIPVYDYSLQITPVLTDEQEIIGDLADLEVTIFNMNTGTSKVLTSDNTGKVYFRDIVGIYRVKVSGNLSYSDIDNQGSIIILNDELFTGIGENILLYENNFSDNVDIYPANIDNGFVIKEMYTASTYTLNGSALRFDQFIEIYNNTDTVMYADGLSIGETTHQTTSGENIYAVKSDGKIRDMDKKTYLWTVYTIPGKSGDRNVPIQPGRSIVIAPQPIDHRPDNSIDLRPPVSDYQWFDAYGSGENSIDVPEVPNLDRYYSSSYSVWVVTVQMNRGFVIFRIPESEGDMAQYTLANTDTRFNNAGKKVTSIGIKNEYILDAVDLGYKHNLYRKSLSSSLDKGFSYTVETYNGKSIRRKILEIKPDGRIVYKDTNDSSLDFWTSRTPAPKQYPTGDEVSHE